jgi:hypothetical protein
MMIAVPAAGAEGLFEQVNIGPVSIGGRATYYDPKDASGEWYGGAQVRLHAFRFLALEGSADEDERISGIPEFIAIPYKSPH